MSAGDASIGVMRASDVGAADQPATTTAASATNRTASTHFVTTTVRVESADVDDGHRSDESNRREPRVSGPQIGPGSERDGGARRGLADDESPPGEIAPQRAERGTGRRRTCRPTRGASRRAGPRRSHCRTRRRRPNAKPISEAGTGGVAGRGPRVEHPGPDHRSGADRHGVGQPQSSS